MPGAANGGFLKDSDVIGRFLPLDNFVITLIPSIDMNFVAAYAYSTGDAGLFSLRIRKASFARTRLTQGHQKSPLKT
jgi:hypothetical protein